MDDEKDPKRVKAGKASAAKRWGPPGTRTVKIADLTPAQRQLVLALIEAARESNEK